MERERSRGYGELDPDDLETHSQDAADEMKKEPPREERPSSKSEPAYDAILGWFTDGNKITISDEQPFGEYIRELSRVPKLAETASKYVQPSERSGAGVLDGDDSRRAASVAAAGARRPGFDDHVQELMKFNVLRTVR